MYKLNTFHFCSRRLLVTAFVLLFISVGPELFAQCPMCKMAAESNLKEGGSSGAGLNAGILYMLCMPYLLVGTLGLLWWRGRQKKKMMLES